MRRSVFWLQRGWSTFGLTLLKKPYSDGCRSCQAVSGIFSTNLISTIDLMPLKPYFHGTTRRSGAPFCCVRGLPYRPVASRASAFIPPSTPRPSVSGPLLDHFLTASISFGTASEVDFTSLVFYIGSHFFLTPPYSRPYHVLSHSPIP